MGPPKPANEAQRLRTLKLYRILDTAAEQTFDDLTRLATTICDTPIGLVSLVDENRQWFKARVGLSAAETSRDVAFCAYALLEDKLMVVEDAAEDERFAHNPLVTAEPSIRFYAGAPLVVREGVSLGTLCVIDRQPRRLTNYQRDALGIIRQAVVAQLELRRAREELRVMEQLLPMCSWCRRVQDDAGAWHEPHHYVMRAVPTSHGICPTCAEGMDPALPTAR